MRPLEVSTIRSWGRWHWMRPLEVSTIRSRGRRHRVRSLKGYLLSCNRRDLTGRHHRYCRQCNGKQPCRIPEFHVFPPMSCNGAQNGRVKIVSMGG
jgi:hypothetical protein